MKKNILIYGLPDKKYLDDLKSRVLKVYIMEGRPDLFGAKILSRKLLDLGLSPILITDNAAAFCIYKKFINEVNLFYYKKDAKSLTCRVGSLVLVVSSEDNNVPVFAYPSEELMKDEANQEDLFYFEGIRTASDGIKAYVPLIDDVPIKFIKEVK